ncbi:hypothetical protein J6590_050135 [Homalodisca vitripennis]|nr:hypothetical protein J6590_050135 [Homalodisca vitripennis]
MLLKDDVFGKLIDKLTEHIKISVRAAIADTLRAYTDELTRLKGQVESLTEYKITREMTSNNISIGPAFGCLGYLRPMERTQISWSSISARSSVFTFRRLISAAPTKIQVLGYMDLHVEVMSGREDKIGSCCNLFTQKAVRRADQLFYPCATVRSTQSEVRSGSSRMYPSRPISSLCSNAGLLPPPPVGGNVHLIAPLSAQLLSKYCF